MHNILVAFDFEEKSGEILAVAEKIATAFRSKVWLVHIAAPEPDFVGYDVGPQYIRDSRADDLREEHQYLQRRCGELKENGIESEALLIQGPTVQALMYEAQALNADLIIAGHHEHGFFYKAFIGSVSIRIFKKSKVPILFVPLD